MDQISAMILGANVVFLWLFIRDMRERAILKAEMQAMVTEAASLRDASLKKVHELSDKVHALQMRG